MTDPTEARRRLVLAEHEHYRVLAEKVAQIRRALDGGEHLADVLARETADLLDSGMTREQVASALVSVMARVAQGEDLRRGLDLADAVLLGVVEVPAVRRGGIRFPLPEEPSCSMS